MAVLTANQTGIPADETHTEDSVGRMPRAHVQSLYTGLALAIAVSAFLVAWALHGNASSRYHIDSQWGALTGLFILALAVERAASIEERQAVLIKLYRSLSLFVAGNFDHMIVEETDNTVTLWELYTDEELFGIQNALVASIAPEKMAVYLRWMIPSISFPERLGMLSGIRATLPPAAFERVLQIVEGSLPARDWTKLSKALGVEHDLVAVAMAS